MKLYTESQVEEMLMKARYHNNDDSEMFTNDYLIAQHKHIELPSDEEIRKEGEWLDNPLERINWREGAKWMREQILKQQL